MKTFILLLSTLLFLSLSTISHSNDMEIHLTWQNQNADLDLYIFNPNKAVCDWTHNDTDWGCRYDAESRGGRNAEDTLPYAEQVSINLSNSSENTGSYTVLAYYYDWQDNSSPHDVQANVEIYHYGELVGTFPIVLEKPGDQAIVWQGVISDKSTNEPPVEPLYNERKRYHLG